MPLSQNQVDRVNTWMRNHNVNLHCPQCNQRNFAPGDVCAMPQFVQGGMVLGGPTVPMLPIFCQNCGHVLFFAAIPILGNENGGH